MKWEILILTQPSRRMFLSQLLPLLNLPVGRFANQTVSVFVGQFDPTMPLGENRERMRQESDAEYISFLDDDDLVPHDYVQKILPLLDGVDQIGFKVKCFTDHQELAPAYHSLKYGDWHQTHAKTINGRPGGAIVGLYRDISHMTPMRRELSLLCPMSGGIGEDCRWAAAIRQTGRVKTEHYIDEFMYWYLWRGNRNDNLDWRDPWRLAMIKKLERPTVETP